MKLIVAIARPEKLNEVLEALFQAEVRGLTLSRVQGHGGETERVDTYRGTTVKMELHEKVRLEIGVSEPFVKPTVEAIRRLGLLRDFPGRTEADLYLWVMDHRYFLARELGVDPGPEGAAKSYEAHFGGVWKRLGGALKRQLKAFFLGEEM